jgi:heme-degrading monooxygenase HmoA
MTVLNLTPPYYAVIFTSTLNEVDEAYYQMNHLTANEVSNIDGFLGEEFIRDKNGFGIHISYWKDQASIENWKNNKLHQHAKKMGIEKWYKNYSVKICKVEQQSQKSNYEI